MSVTLQIVGIYYEYDIDTDDIPGYNYSVKQIIDAAQSQTNPDGSTLAYGYAQTTNGNYVDFISATYISDVTSPVSKNTYVPGTYALAQNFTAINGNTYTVWQYYIFDSNNTIVAAGSSPETPFDQGSPVLDGYTIVWRLVTICGAVLASTGANQTSGVMAPGVNARFAKLIGKPFPKS